MNDFKHTFTVLREQNVKKSLTHTGNTQLNQVIVIGNMAEEKKNLKSHMHTQ